MAVARQAPPQNDVLTRRSTLPIHQGVENVFVGRGPGGTAPSPLPYNPSPNPDSSFWLRQKLD